MTASLKRRASLSRRVRTSPARASVGIGAVLLTTSLAFQTSAQAQIVALDPQAGSDRGLRQAFELAMYSVDDSGDGTYRGVNPAQRLTLEFSAREARLSHPEGSVQFHLTG